jgi:hypothetical protein
MKNNKFPEDEKTIENILMLLESFMFVLWKWTRELSRGDIGSINYLDKSLINDINTISDMWLDKDYKNNELGDIDFF